MTVPIAKKALGPWKTLKLRRGASVGFREDGRGTILQLQDSGDGGYVAVSRALSPQSAVGGTVDINRCTPDAEDRELPLADQRLTAPAADARSRPA